MRREEKTRGRGLSPWQGAQGPERGLELGVMPRGWGRSSQREEAPSGLGRRKGQALSYGTGRSGDAPAAEPKDPGLIDLRGAGACGRRREPLERSHRHDLIRGNVATDALPSPSLGSAMRGAEGWRREELAVRKVEKEARGLGGQQSRGNGGEHREQEGEQASRVGGGSVEGRKRASC